MRASVPGLTALAYLGCALIWGTTWFAIRVCIARGGYPTLAGAAIRFFVAVAVLGVLAGLKVVGRGPVGWRQLGWVAAAGVLCGLAYALVYASETHITGGVAAVIFGTLPLVTALIVVRAGVRAASAAVAAAASADVRTALSGDLRIGGGVLALLLPPAPHDADRRFDAAVRGTGDSAAHR
ncbi:MAG TPA: EamA family transporter, partial [Verrucomicrobiae bacterium]|nr:EamA family transporter [Verrucomicrobiae bacterium]